MKKLIFFLFFSLLFVWLFYPQDQDKKNLEEKAITKTVSKNITVDQNQVQIPSLNKEISKVEKKKLISSSKLKMNLIKKELITEKILKENFSNRSRLKFNKDYLISNNLRAIVKKSYQSDMGEIYDEYHGYIFYKVSEISESKILNASKRSLPVVFDTRRKIFGVITGKIIVELKNKNDQAQVIKHYNLSLDMSSPPFLFLSGKSSRIQMGQMISKLEKDKTLKSFEIEIITGLDTPN